MSRKTIRTVAVVILALGVVWSGILAEPATAAFSWSGNLILTDASNRQFVPTQRSGCNIYVDTTNSVWLVWSQVYYFRSNITNTSVPLALGILRNEVTGEVWDGGFGNSNITSAGSVPNLVSTLLMPCPAT
jgi:hypothetical protein